MNIARTAQSTIVFEETRTVARGPHARKVLILRPIRASVDVANEASAAVVRRLVRLLNQGGRHA